MKNIVLLLLLSLPFACTQQEVQEIEKKFLCNADVAHYTIPGKDNISLELPSCFRHIQSAGIDTEVGKFVADEAGLTLFYDIGIAAGYQVSQESPTKQVFRSVNQEFWYDKKGGSVYFTFPNAGPANFYTDDEAYANELIEVMKTLQTN